MQTSKNAVIVVSNKQYLVKEGETVELDRYAAKIGDKVKFDQVLLTFEGDKAVVGTPTIAKATVEGEVMDHVQGKKVRSFTYKAKSRVRKTTGARAKLTLVKISKIN